MRLFLYIVWLLEIPRRKILVKLPAVLGAPGPFRIVAVEQPLARMHRRLLVLHRRGHVNAVRDTMAVGDDERRAVVGFGFEEGLQRVLVLCAHRDAGDIYVAVGHRDE